MKMTLPLEEKFARDWIEGWNTHALERVLSHYADDFEMSSPFIGQFGDGRQIRLGGPDNLYRICCFPLIHS